MLMLFSVNKPISLQKCLPDNIVFKKEIESKCHLQATYAWDISHKALKIFIFFQFTFAFSCEPVLVGMDNVPLRVLGPRDLRVEVVDRLLQAVPQVHVGFPVQHLFHIGTLFFIWIQEKWWSGREQPSLRNSKFRTFIRVEPLNLEDFNAHCD